MRWDRVGALGGVLLALAITVLLTLTGGRSTPTARADVHGAAAHPAAAHPAATAPAGVAGPGTAPGTPTAVPSSAAAGVNPVDAPGCPPERRAPVVGSAPGAGRTVALTFDDGPSRWTPQVLDILARAHVPATFFVIGGNAAADRQAVRDEVARGHLVGNHTWTHTPPTHGRSWPAGKLGDELDRTDALLRATTGTGTCWFRPPAGVVRGTAGPAAQRGLSVVLWSVDTQDWLVQDGARADTDGRLARIIAARAEAGADQDHPLVLLHDGGGYRGATVDALPQVIAYYQARGYRFVRIDGGGADPVGPDDR